MEMTRFNKILNIDEVNLYAEVEPGVITVDLHKAVEARGLFYPPDPGSQKVSTIGGNAGENAGGLRGLKYGITKDYVMGLEVVTPTGNIVKTGAKMVKTVAGYDMTKLLIGSEGTLGVITKLILKLIPKPEYAKTMIAIFNELDEAANAVVGIISKGVLPVTLEIMDNITINKVEDLKKIGLPRDAGAILLLETDGVKEAAEKEAEKVIVACKECNAREIKVAQTEAEKLGLWEGRRAALPSLSRAKPSLILEDATVPRSNIPAFIKGVNKLAQENDILIGTFGHAGDGNLHPTILTDLRIPGEKEKVDKVVDGIFRLALELDGTISGEHGIGTEKAAFLELEVGKQGVEEMKKIKRALDPNNILNPGKIFIGGDI